MEKNHFKAVSVESWNLHLMPSLFSESQEASTFAEKNGLKARAKNSKKYGAASRQKVNSNVWWVGRWS